MQEQYGLLCLLCLFISGYYAQDPTTTINPNWFGDPRLCTTNPPPTPSTQTPPPFPKFPAKAEFTLERVEVSSLLSNITFPSKLSLYEYLFDYNANTMILVKNQNGFIDAEYYYYNILKKSTYYGGRYCVVTDIGVNNIMDGASAIKLADGTWHVRPLNEFLLVSSDVPDQQITPVYIGNDTIRGIPVHKWLSCYVDRSQYRTVRRIWSFAQQGVNTPTGLVGEYAHPIQADISGSFDFPNGTQIAEVDELYNVISYRSGIAESSSQLAPPKGVFCGSGQGQALVSLRDVGAGWPNRFSVRVEASTSRSTEWQRFHLRYDSGRDGSSRRLRYDYTPPGAEDFVSVIHDYANQLTYTIDRRAGSCRINRTVDIPDVSPTRDPIEFFIKNEGRFIFNPPENAWEFNGFRACRGNTIQCTILTASIDNFPAMVDIDTGKPTGENWAATNIEYAWSRRAPFAPSFMNRTRFDYPATLYLRLYRFENPSQPSVVGLRSEDIEYEFFEMSHERHPQDFDVSTCYRSLGYEYLHLMFVMKLNRGDIVDSNHLDRRELEFFLYFAIRNASEVTFSRISEIEVDHERAGNDVTVFFTLLGRTPNPGSPTGFADEITADTARNKLKTVIDNDQFYFDFPLMDNSTVQFKAQSGSLKGSKLYMSTHAAGRARTIEKYSSGAEATAIIVGLLIGLIVGVIIAGVIRVSRGKPMPKAISLSNPLPSTINFRSNKNVAATSA
ncbi:unnamed protein product [Adineta ricciae]|uniref:Uncharacterized protein n=1 Tax=Adineta ricciae TaxID=249248 RepID=A0A814E3Y3_ADIRI|nr:unnamed protein product [Adineta ricciae]